MYPSVLITGGEVKLSILMEQMKVLRRKGSKVFMLFASCSGKELKVYNR